MAQFAKKSIQSKTCARLQRCADALPHVTGRVRQFATTTGSHYVFDGSARNGMIKCNGHTLGDTFGEARKALHALNTIRRVP